MTLAEAYEKQRQEVLALRRELEKYRAGRCPGCEAYEKEVRQLRTALARMTKERDRFHELWRKAVSDGGNYETQSEIGALRAQLQEANALIAKQKAQMNRDYENSSIPSSQKPFHKKIKNSREITGKKPGAQVGHTGAKRPHMEPTVPVVEIMPSKEILSDRDYYPTGKYVTKQVVDLDISVSVTEYRAQIYRSRSTGKRVHGDFPQGIVNEFNYGSTVKGLAFLLNNYCNVSIDKTSELIEGISGGKVVLSKGFINNLPGQFSAATARERRDMYGNLLLAPSMHTDFTVGRVNGKNVHVMVCGNKSNLLYFFREHKGHSGVKDTPVEEYCHILIHDHDKTFYNYGTGHQECLAHVLRYLQDSIENEPALTWNAKMKEFLSGVIHEAKQDRVFSNARITEIEAKYDRILNIADKEYMEHPPGKYYPDGFNLYTRMRNYRDSHLLFLRHPEIDYTNNLSERALRKFKRKQKQAVTFRSNESVAFLCDCMSVIESRRLRGWNIFKTACAAFS